MEKSRQIALSEGIAPETFDSATKGLAPVESIAAMNANQPEFNRPVWEYLDSAVSARRVEDGRTMLAQYGDALARIQARTGVPRDILVAIWGMETDYGASVGNFNLFAALATLAYQGPRSGYGTPEFLAALQIYQQRHYPLQEMVGSWAGAFGQTQFTPTNFLKYACDGDGDGQIDLWHSAPDALASAAKLLSDQGWQKDQSWGYEVSLPRRFNYADADLDSPRPISQWRALGVKTANRSEIPASDDTQQGAIFLPAGAHGPAFLLMPNFYVLLKYNDATSYALAVGLLADRISGRSPPIHSWPRNERPLSREERVTFQADLQKLGFDPGTLDGVLGRKTRAALRLYQQSRGLLADGYASATMLMTLSADIAARP